MLAPLRQSVSLRHSLVLANRLSKSGILTNPIRVASTLNDGASKAHDHSMHFKIERIWAAGMVPIIPAAYFIHNPVMDALLTIALTMHIHWGVQGVIADYARPFVLGAGPAKLANMSLYLLTGLLLAGLLHFNTNDVGITKAFEMKMVKLKKMSQEKRKKWQKVKNGKRSNRRTFFKFQNMKKEIPSQPKPLNPSKDAKIRKRGEFLVINPPENSIIPSCEHGPCLIFGQKNGDESTWHYVCAVYRKGECDFRRPYLEASEAESSPNLEEKDPRYGAILKKLKTIPKSSKILFCAECMDIFENKHPCVCQYVKRSQLRQPSRLLSALENQNGEAQYLFSKESLDQICLMILSSTVDAVVCVGAPRLYETLRRSMKHVDVFLLDYDTRYAPFSPALKFAQYSMLVHHFYDGKAKRRFRTFLKKHSSILVICDPPFGVFIEPLLQSIGKIKAEFEELHAKSENPVFYGCFVLPYFVGKHVLKSDASYWMSDLKITYDNHKDFGKPGKSPVRIFTNLPKSTIQLSSMEEYRFCEMCEKYVASTNLHCFQCEKCPSKDGSTYRHCNRCKRCFKQTYNHCAKCKACHLPKRCHQKDEEEE
ncbi:hypothetical protein WR25_25248 [Diploscapter pachys]|uniref:Succinate dehydrogenase [ubiquinone] cytochrome b small subunit n=1 Tax=Diploscapter pachys TaxID=2018661 RepID=A0A2A2LE95_9BILA|nr:hypothetical protein WR25_25248 [Diploscapter pachys]